MQMKNGRKGKVVTKVRRIPLGWHFNLNNRKGAGKNHLIINFNQNGIVAGLFKFETVNVIDQIDSVLRAGRFEFAVDDGSRFLFSHRKTDGHFEFMLAQGKIGKGEKPDHSWMNHGEFLCPET